MQDEGIGEQMVNLREETEQEDNAKSLTEEKMRALRRNL